MKKIFRLLILASRALRRVRTSKPRQLELPLR